MRRFDEHLEETRLVVLDVEMPKRSGTSCADEIHRRREDLPVILITGSVAPAVNRSPRQNEMMLPKPFKMAELIDLENHAVSATV